MYLSIGLFGKYDSGHLMLTQILMLEAALEEDKRSM